MSASSSQCHIIIINDALRNTHFVVPTQRVVRCFWHGGHQHRHTLQRRRRRSQVNDDAGLKSTGAMRVAAAHRQHAHIAPQSSYFTLFKWYTARKQHAHMCRHLMSPRARASPYVRRLGEYVILLCCALTLTLCIQARVQVRMRGVPPHTHYSTLCTYVTSPAAAVVNTFYARGNKQIMNT